MAKGLRARFTSSGPVSVGANAVRFIPLQAALHLLLEMLQWGRSGSSLPASMASDTLAAASWRSGPSRKSERRSRSICP